MDSPSSLSILLSSSSSQFNEHMLFLGTKQYPNEDSFEKFLSANGGSSNAYTASENTVYHFTLQQTDDGSGGRSGTFGEGLKRFGSFFTSPLFTESATGRELNAIESENAKNLQSDSFRMYQINKERQNPKHPHSKFFTGNKKTLLDDTKAKGINLRQSLIDFYTRYYSADQMTLAVVGPQPISKLQDLTKEAFSDIPNRSVGPPENVWKGIIPPYTDNDTTGAVKESLTTAPPVIPSFGNVVKVVPVQDLRQITVVSLLFLPNRRRENDVVDMLNIPFHSYLICYRLHAEYVTFNKRHGRLSTRTTKTVNLHN